VFSPGNKKKGVEVPHQYRGSVTLTDRTGKASYSLCAKNKVEKLNLQRIRHIISINFRGKNQARQAFNNTCGEVL